jgi:Plasmid encoded RepA protein
VKPGRLQIGRGCPVLFGVPYGVRTRLILLYPSTEAVRRESRAASLGRSMRDWLI